MSRWSLAAILVAAPASLASCAPSSPAAAPRSAAAVSAARAPTAPARVTPDEPFRHRAPALPAPTTFTPPAVQSLRLSNGVRVLLLERHDPPFLRVELVLAKGSGAYGAASVVPQALFAGTTRHTGAELAAARGAELAESGWWATPTTVGIHYTGLASHASALVSQLAEVTQEASLPTSSVIRILQNDAELARQRDASAASVAARVLPMALYGGSRPEDAWGSLREPDLGRLSALDVAAAYASTFDPSAATLLVVGDTTPEQIGPLLERSFGRWKGRGKRAAAPAIEAKVVTSGPRVIAIDRPGAPDSYVLFGGAAPAFGSPEWPAARTVKALLTSAEGTAQRTLVSEKQLTWSWTASLVTTPTAPRVVCEAQVAMPRTGEALRAIDAELRALRDVDEAALSAARARMVRVAPEWLTTLAREADVVEGIVLLGLPIDDPQQRPARFAAVTVDDARRAASRYFDPDRMKIVVVGDWSALRGQVAQLGWGPIELRDVTGKVLRVEEAR